jgi:hypothetical protein
MEKQFNTAAASGPCEAERALAQWGIQFQKKDDGTIVVPGDLYLTAKGLTELPDLSEVIVEGGFYCDSNKLTSLRGAPRSVGGNFWCRFNQLVSLEGAPEFIPGDFECRDNRLPSLKGGPRRVEGSYWCDRNELVSLEGAPETLKFNFACGENRLRSLKGAMKALGGGFFCAGNELTSLEDAPRKFRVLGSDFGEFKSWEEVPEKLKVSPETIEAMIVLQAPVTAAARLKLKARLGVADIV